MDQDRFSDRSRTHVLMITNHGVHGWNVVPGLPDTGGQNVYVNQFTEALVSQGYRVTIVNRGGYPHPVTGEPRTGVRFHPGGHARILYLEDGRSEFVRKEDMAGQISALVVDLERRLRAEGDHHDLIVSHYWDAGVLGAALNDRTPDPVPHVWVPHSLGALKKRNLEPSTWESLRIEERIGHERDLLGRIDGGVATSTAIRDSFRDDYGYEARFFLPPCVDTGRYGPAAGGDCEHVWDFLAERSSLTAEELRRRPIVTEISRTDRTKRKDVLIRAFDLARRKVAGAVLVVALDERAGAPYAEATALIRSLGLEHDVIVLGSVWEVLPCIYRATTVYCTPSVMEGFGMSAQEAAATARPVVASDLVPFASEYLLGGDPHPVPIDGGDPERSLLIGDGAVVVPADDVAGFALALTTLLGDPAMARDMGYRALAITVPYFTWANRTRDLLDALGLSPTRTRRA